MGYVYDDGCCPHGKVFESVPCQPIAGTLDEAWKAAEAALPEGWLMEMRGPWDGPIWRFRARCLHDGNCHSVDADGPTPAAALLALAARLSKPASPAIAARDGGEP